MKANMPIIYRNIMDGLSSDLGRNAFLWATERQANDCGCYKSEKFAHDVERLAQTLTPMLDESAAIHGVESHDPDLMRFTLARHANLVFGGNQRPTYMEAKP